MTMSASSFRNALPFWASLALPPLAWAGAVFGGWALLLVPLFALVLSSFLDALLGEDRTSPEKDEAAQGLLFWHRMITLIWTPIQFITLFSLITFIATADHLAVWEVMMATYCLGLITGGVGIVYAHELMHKSSRLERWLGDIQLAMVMYGHYRSEHLLVHHPFVGTPRDTVTARYNEGFHRFFWRVPKAGLIAAWQAETKRLGGRKLSHLHFSNPFWRYAALQLGFLALAAFLGGWIGLLIFLGQAFVAIWLLELINYIEHYGLTRKHLGDGQYEHQRKHHSWDCAQRATGWLLINVQRHSDHHYRPNKRYPLLQVFDEDEAPQLPFGYPIMGALAMIPPLWRRRMNPRVRAWRKRFYPEISDWTAYNLGKTPKPE